MITNTQIQDWVDADPRPKETLKKVLTILAFDECLDSIRELTEYIDDRAPSVKEKLDEEEAEMEEAESESEE